VGVGVGLGEGWGSIRLSYIPLYPLSWLELET